MRYPELVPWCLTIIALLVLLLAATLVARGAASSACTSSVTPDREPETRCAVLWLPQIAQAAGKEQAPPQ